MKVRLEGEVEAFDLQQERFIAKVGREDLDLDAIAALALLSEFFEALDAPRDQDQVCSVRCQCPGVRASNAGGSASDERSFPTTLAWRRRLSRPLVGRGARCSRPVAGARARGTWPAQDALPLIPPRAPGPSLDRTYSCRRRR
jgi:hypothetical protein